MAFAASFVKPRCFCYARWRGVELGEIHFRFPYQAVLVEVPVPTKGGSPASDSPTSGRTRTDLEGLVEASSQSREFTPFGEGKGTAGTGPPSFLKTERPSVLGWMSARRGVQETERSPKGAVLLRRVAAARCSYGRGAVSVPRARISGIAVASRR